jgi:4-hydroxy-L-threonine phosphate dehydrogenase PdxA
MSKNEKLKVGISIGDIAGIGPEVILKTFTDDRLYKLFTPVLFANSKVLSFYRKVLNIEKIQYSAVKDMDNLSHNSLNIINCWEEEVQITPGQPNEKTGELALKSLESATEALKSGAIDILITAPINKSVIHSEKFPFSGHTPYLQNKLGGNEVLMFMVSDNIKVGLSHGAHCCKRYSNSYYSRSNFKEITINQSISYRRFWHRQTTNSCSRTQSSCRR